MNGVAGEDERVWERGWEGHSLEQQRRLARLPLRKKLEWLESAQRLADHLAGERARRARSGPDRKE